VLIRLAKCSILMILIIGLLTACGTNKTLKVGIETNFKPFSYVEDGEKKGFEVDLWEAVAKEAGLRYELVPLGMGELLKELETGKIDAVLSGVTINNERKKKFEFTTAYYTAGLVMVTTVDNMGIMTTKNLQDKIVSTKIGTSAYKYASTLKGIKEIKAYPDVSKAYEVLIKKEADAVIFDKQTAEFFAENEGQGKVKVGYSTLTKEQYAIALEKGSKYTGRLNNALRALAKNKEYERIYVKWFDEKPKSLPGEKTKK
jgi:glutamine transport system substrate-binding protein